MSQYSDGTWLAWCVESLHCLFNCFIEANNKENIKALYYCSFVHYFVQGIYQWLVESPHRGPVIDGILPKGPALLAGYPRNVENISMPVHHHDKLKCGKGSYGRISSWIRVQPAWKLLNLIKCLYTLALFCRSPGVWSSHLHVSLQKWRELFTGV